MFITAKTRTGAEFAYSSKTAILCKSREQAQTLAEFMNTHNESAQGVFKLKDGEIYHVYEIDKYDRAPLYRLKSTRGAVKVAYNI